jgi:hypothetical protein
MNQQRMQGPATPALDDDGLEGARGILTAVAASVATGALLWLAMAMAVGTA